MGRPRLEIGEHGKIASRTIGPKLALATTWIRDPDGKRRRVEARGKSKAAAERALNKRLDARVPPSNHDITANTTLEELATVWLDQVDKSKRARQTRQRYREVCQDHIVKKRGEMRIRDATVGALSRFLSEVTDDVGLPTAKLVRTNLIGMMKIATSHDAVDRNRARETVLNAEKVVKPVTAPSIDDVRRMRKCIAADPVAVKYEIPAIVDTLLGTGARIGEVCAIKPEDLDLEALIPAWRVSGTVIEERGVGAVRQEMPKTASSRRTLNLPPFVADMLRERIKSGEPFVFMNMGKTGPRDPNHFRKHWRPLAQKYELPDITPKSFRKAVATLLAQEDIAIAGSQLGHAPGSDVTRKHYVVHSFETPDSRDALQKFAIESGG
jgi:integrase